jgi:hypothetical protein
MTFINRHWSPPTRVLGRALLLLCPLIRAYGYRLAARATGRADLTGKADSWRAIWQCRRAWIGGYASAPTELGPPLHRERQQV